MIKTEFKKIKLYIYFALFNVVLLSSVCAAELKIVAPAEVFQGRSFIIFLSSAETVKEANAYFDGKKIKFFPYEGGLRAIIGTEPEKKTGYYNLRIEAVTNSGELEIEKLSIAVSHRLYPKVSFFLKPSKKELLSPDLIVREWAQIEEKILYESKDKLWDEFFMKPVSGMTTMRFGTREYINGKPTGRHRGQDFRAKVGTPIKAGHNGKVIVSQFFKAFGGTVVIDHGQGINTLYFHLSKILADVGQEIEKGEILGLSGNTGISSGPHLHWGMSVHNVRVDPMQWVETVIP